MKETFPKSSVMIMADMVGYADGGVVSKQVLKNDAGNITLFSFDEGQGLSEHTAPSMHWCRIWKARWKLCSLGSRCV